MSRIEAVKINPHLNYVVIDGVEFQAKGSLMQLLSMMDLKAGKK